MATNQLPVVTQNGGYENGPGLRDPRLNLEYNLFIKNKMDGEKFWVKYISGTTDSNSYLLEVRWDLFEDALLAYLQQTIIFNGDELSSLSWHIFFGVLFAQLAKPEELATSDCPMNPMASSFTPRPMDYWGYTGVKVRKSDWVSFIKDIGFQEYAKKCMTVGTEDPVMEARYMQKLNQMKSSKTGLVVYEDGSQYDGQREKGRPHGKGLLTYAGKIGMYDGEFQNGRRHGYGVETQYVAEAATIMKYMKDEELIMPEPNMIYRGEWKNDMRHGYGVQNFYDGSRFEGQWEYGQQRFGTYVWADGAEYSGDFSGPVLEGRGTMKLEDEVITGNWLDSKLEGEKGERRMANGDRYIGKWVRGRLQGYGEHHTQDESYTGHYFANRENGKGKKVFHKMGAVYEGLFKDGLFEGLGKQYYQSGDYYQGDFKEGLRHGKGTFKFANGDEYTGDWVRGEQTGQGVLKSKYQAVEGGIELQSVYTGQFLDGLFHGQGKFEVEDGFVYEGEFAEGLRQGMGKLKVPVNDVTHEYFKDVGFEIYEGEFKNDLLNGYAKAAYPDGITYEGQWIDGKKCGRGILRRHDYEIAGVFEEDQLVGPNWREALKAGDMNMKFLDYMFSLDKWQQRPQGGARRLNMPDNSKTLKAKNPTLIQK